MRIGWIGFHLEGTLAFRRALESGFRLEAALTLSAEAASRRSGAADYAPLCREFGVPLYQVADINEARALDILKSLSLDVAFVIGWTQLVRREALRSVTTGMIGAHASLLPRNRGRAPINWALIRGERVTGNTLFWLSEEADAGPLIDQTTIPITVYDTCATLYERVAESNCEMILRLLPRLLAGEAPAAPQPASAEAPLARRRPQDGLIDWTRSSSEVYDFVRALTVPYPGAYGWLNGERWTVWRCALLPGGLAQGALPGEVVGPMYSPSEGACGQVVACGSGAVVVLEMEGGGEIISGHRLSERKWKGQMWTND